jgi:hypothetical protein
LAAAAGGTEGVSGEMVLRVQALGPITIGSMQRGDQPVVLQYGNASLRVSGCPVGADRGASAGHRLFMEAVERVCGPSGSQSSAFRKSGLVSLPRGYSVARLAGSLGRFTCGPTRFSRWARRAIKMSMRWFTRLTNALSEKVENLTAGDLTVLYVLPLLPSPLYSASPQRYK